MVSEPTCRALCYSGAGCLSSVGTFLRGTVLQGCRLYKLCWNLPAIDCATVVKAVSAMLESTCRALCYSGSDYLSGVGICCRALCYSGADSLSRVGTYLRGAVLQ